MNCYSCDFYDKNDYLHGYGTCEIQDEDFKCDHECNLTDYELDNAKTLIYGKF